MATSYKTIDDVVEAYVRPALGRQAKFYDLVSIAYKITYYRRVWDGEHVCLDRSQRVLKDAHDPKSECFHADMFWYVAEDSRKEN